MRRLQPTQVQTRSITALGLDADRYSLTSVESIAAALRRAAGYLCPCADSTLVRNVVEPMRGLVTNLSDIKTRVEATLDQLVALGDLFEYRDFSNSGSVVLYAAPCGFVPRTSGTMILIGISADQLSALPSDLEARIEALGCVRLLRPLSGERLREDLQQIGLIEVSYDRWTKCPSVPTADALVKRTDSLLIEKPSSGDIPGLLILDPALPVHFYPGRWIDPAGKSGRFVARRNQAYGAPLWCYVDLKDGQPVHLLDLPVANSRWRGCDEAWHLQMAIDSRRGEPQLFGIRRQLPGKQDLLIHSPIPMWAQRRWDAIGERIDSGNCLMAFRFHDNEIQQECGFARSALWLEEEG